MDATPEHSPSSGSSPAPPVSGNDKQEIKREIIDFVKLVAWFLVIFLGLRTYVIEGYEVQGPSMLPALENNQRILVFKLPHKLSEWGVLGDLAVIKQGDIIVFESPDAPGKRYVKRVIAAGPKADGRNTVDAEAEGGGGTVVPVKFDRGTVYVNNHVLDEEYLTERARNSHDTQDLLLQAGEFYVLGDNRGVSKDSRSFDAIHDEVIIGKAVFRFWPLNRISSIQ